MPLYDRPPWDFPLAGVFYFDFLGWHPDSPGVGGAAAVVFLQVIRLQGFSWYDFASFDDSSSAKLGQFYRRIRGWGEFLKVALLFFLRRVSKENRARGSVCGSKNDITESVHNKISLERALEKFKGTSWNSSPPRIFL